MMTMVGNIIVPSSRKKNEVGHRMQAPTARSCAFRMQAPTIANAAPMAVNV